MTTSQVAIRTARAEDADACAAIYAPYVLHTAVSFETDPPSPEQMRDRIAAAVARHAWLVAEVGSRVVGYAYGGPFASRPAYDWSCEVSVYLDPDAHGRGLGRRLYRELLDRLRKRGFRTAVAKIALPNPASLALHAAFGFTPVGVFRGIGFKSGTWHDVWEGQLELTSHRGAPAPLR